MKRLFYIITHPITYFRFRRTQELMILLYAACEMLHIEDISVWDVDKLMDMLNQILEALHEDPHLLDGIKVVMERLFWTRLLSRFKKLTISRETTRHMVDTYNFTINTIKTIKKENPTMADVVTVHVLMVQALGTI